MRYKMVLTFCLLAAACRAEEDLQKASVEQLQEKVVEAVKAEDKAGLMAAMKEIERRQMWFFAPKPPKEEKCPPIDVSRKWDPFGVMEASWKVYLIKKRLSEQSCQRCWRSETDNFDDFSMMIAGKSGDELTRDDLPKFRATLGKGGVTDVFTMKDKHRAFLRTHCKGLK